MKTTILILALLINSGISQADTLPICTACHPVQSPFGPEPLETFYRYDVIQDNKILARWDFVTQTQCLTHRLNNSNCIRIYIDEPMPCEKDADCPWGQRCIGNNGPHLGFCQKLPSSNGAGHGE